MGRSIDDRCNYVAQMILANPKLSIGKAAEYAARIAAAESRGDHGECRRLVMEAAGNAA